MAFPSAAPGPGPVGVLGLRCNGCGAPLAARPGQDLLACDFCGSVQKLVDARAFLDQILLQVNAWVRQAMPVGIDAAAPGAVDPVARHSIFVNSIRPRLSTEYAEHRYGCFNVLSHPLIVLPNMVDAGVPHPRSPKDVFLFQAKAKNVESLAVDEEGRKLLAEVGGLSVVYAYLLNNVALMAELRPERYHLMAQNCEAAARAVAGLNRFPGLAERLQGLTHLARGLDHVVAGRAHEALADVAEAQRLLDRAKAAASHSFDMGVVLQALDAEMSLARSAAAIAQACTDDPKGNPAATLGRVQNLLGLLARLQLTPYAQWQASFRHPKHHEEILRAAADIRRAQRGAASIRVLPATGTVLFPFWAVDMPYSFQTGVLWATQGVEVTEALLLSATFPVDTAASSAVDPSVVLTDVFRARERHGFFDDAVKRLSGRETTISGGGPVREAIRGAAPSPAAMAAVPPLSTREDAAALVQTYMIRARQLDRTIDKKLRLSSPRVLDLVYVPGAPAGGTVRILPHLGGLAIRSVGDLSILSTIALEL